MVDKVPILKNQVVELANSRALIAGDRQKVLEPEGEVTENPTQGIHYHAPLVGEEVLFVKKWSYAQVFDQPKFTAKIEVDKLDRYK